MKNRDEAALLRAVHSSPGQETPRLVYADYLDDQGRDMEAKIHRALAVWHRPEDDPTRQLHVGNLMAHAGLSLSRHLSEMALDASRRADKHSERGGHVRGTMGSNDAATAKMYTDPDFHVRGMGIFGDNQYDLANRHRELAQRWHRAAAEHHERLLAPHTERGTETSKLARHHATGVSLHWTAIALHEMGQQVSPPELTRGWRWERA